jgi:Domain of unknown function (DUF4232)
MTASLRAARRALVPTAAAAALALATAASAASQGPATADRGRAAHRHVSTPACTAADLGVWLAVDQGNGAAGSIFYPLQFTNLSHRACTLTGFARVAAIDAHGHRLGAAASRGTGVPVRTVRLAAGATAHAVLRYSNVVVGDCPAASRRAAFELRVFPPGKHAAAHAMFSLAACDVPGSRFLSVQAIQPGPGRAAPAARASAGRASRHRHAMRS